MNIMYLLFMSIKMICWHEPGPFGSKRQGEERLGKQKVRGFAANHMGW